MHTQFKIQTRTRARFIVRLDNRWALFLRRQEEKERKNGCRTDYSYVSQRKTWLVQSGCSRQERYQLFVNIIPMPARIPNRTIRGFVCFVIDFPSGTLSVAFSSRLKEERSVAEQRNDLQFSVARGSTFCLAEEEGGGG